MAANVKPLPEGFHTVTPYLTVQRAADLIDFVKKVFGATEVERMTSPDGAVRHAEVKIGDSIIMIGGAPDQASVRTGQIYLYTSDVDATHRRAIQAGATSLREPVDMFYGDRCGGLRDTWGNDWWIATHIEDVAPAEMQRRASAATQHA
jgi:PhnB protein